MSMVVRTNTMALNANNALNKNNSTVAGNLEKLSTGFKINRAADDASGLAISEKMKAQIKALDTASKNAEDGASLIKTAEGYMGEVHDMLNRIVELAEKSANGTYETKEGVSAKGETYTENGNEAATSLTGIDRQALQDEVNQLSAEIDRIASTANFNGLKIMDGSMDTKASERLKATVGTADSVTNGTITTGSVTLAADTNAKGAALRLQIGETSTSNDRLNVNIKSFKTEYLFAEIAGSNTTETSGEGGSATTTTKTTAAVGDDGAMLVARNDKNGSHGVSENSAGLTLNISNQTSAAKVAEKVRDVINNVSAQRAELGAMENRIDYTINNLTTASENITDANSRIRDTDMAKTMMQYTQGNTLTQAAQAMLAQANQAPSQVLQLLQ